jgi:hypothetical protein
MYKSIKPIENLFGEPSWTPTQMATLVHIEMEKNGHWKIELQKGLSGHLLKNNNNFEKLNFNGIYYIFKKHGLDIIPLYIGESSSKTNSMDNRIGKYIKWNRGQPRGKSGSIHRDFHSAAIRLRERGISNVEKDNVYVMWASYDFIYGILKKAYQDQRHMKLVDIEKKLIKKIKPIGNQNV